jgi:hypothetical protein
VSPVARRKAVVRWLWEAKPVSAAIRASDVVVLSINERARDAALLDEGVRRDAR